MSPSAKDLYKDLENYAKQEKQHKNKQFKTLDRRNKRSFPWGIILIVCICASGYFLYMMDYNKTQKYAVKLVGVAKKTVENYNKTGEFKILKDSPQTFLLEETKKLAPASAKTQSVIKKEYVQIDGKYYEKKKDNIYFINGKKVFFKTDKTISLEQKNAEPVLKTKEILQNRSDSLNAAAEYPSQ